jgi:hypothetical protein
MIRRAVVAAVAGAVLAVIAGLSSPASAATPSCTGASCDGKDVSTTNCHDARAYAIEGRHVDGDPVVFDLWYSPSCHAMWGDYQITAEAPGFVSLYGVAPYSGSGEAKEVYVKQTSPSINDLSTTLVNSMQSVKLCWHTTPGLPQSDFSVAGFLCTGWH